MDEQMDRITYLVNTFDRITSLRAMTTIKGRDTSFQCTNFRFTQEIIKSLQSIAPIFSRAVYVILCNFRHS